MQEKLRRVRGKRAAALPVDGRIAEQLDLVADCEDPTMSGQQIAAHAVEVIRAAGALHPTKDWRLEAARRLLTAVSPAECAAAALASFHVFFEDDYLQADYLISEAIQAAHDRNSLKPVARAFAAAWSAYHQVLYQSFRSNDYTAALAAQPSVVRAVSEHIDAVVEQARSGDHDARQAIEHSVCWLAEAGTEAAVRVLARLSWAHRYLDRAALDLFYRIEVASVNRALARCVDSAAFPSVALALPGTLHPEDGAVLVASLYRLGGDAALPLLARACDTEQYDPQIVEALAGRCGAGAAAIRQAAEQRIAARAARTTLQRTTDTSWLVRYEAVCKLLKRPARRHVLALCRAEELDDALQRRYLERCGGTAFGLGHWIDRWPGQMPPHVLHGTAPERTVWALQAELPKQTTTPRLDQVAKHGAAAVAAEYPEWAVHLTDSEVAAFERQEAELLAK